MDPLIAILGLVFLVYTAFALGVVVGCFSKGK